MKRYIDFVQKPKSGHTVKEEPTTFISVPEKKPAARPAATTAKPTATTGSQPKPTTATAFRPHFKPDFGPIRRRPLGQPAPRVSVNAQPVVKTAPQSTPATQQATNHPVSQAPIRVKRPVMDMTRPRVATRSVNVSPSRPSTPKPVTKPAVKPAIKTAIKPVTKPAVRPIVKPVKPVKSVEPVENYVENPAENPVENFDDDFDSIDDMDSIFGIIEDYHPVSNTSEITKRPLSTPGQRATSVHQAQEDDLEALIDEQAAQAAASEQEARKEASVKRSSKLNEFLKAGKSPFIRTASVEKRPLSNSVAAKKPIVAKSPKDEPSDPATIIEKPEKDAHVGIIVTVILTIVFGAAIGTAAFLLLPK